MKNTTFFELQGAEPASTPDRGPVVTMVACMLSLLVMLCACSPPSFAQEIAHLHVEREPATLSAAFSESFTVTPSNEDRAPRANDRWQRFRDALDSGPRRTYWVTDTATNRGVREACYEPCQVNCCVSSGEFSLSGARFGR
jgi:hypothetical protein